jgi:glycosyltransferase involved in cell wall biosynthesis
MASDRHAEFSVERTRTRLSVVLITLNEEANLPRCLESVKGLADEVVVVDSGSSDATAAIALEAGCRLIQREFTGYGEQKQFALEQARGDWLLCLDADEWLDNRAHDAISSLLREPPPEPVCGFRLCRQFRYLGRWLRFGPWAGERKLRLVRRGCARWSKHSVHESMYLVQGRCGDLSGRLLHEPYRDLSHQLGKIDRYTELIAERDASMSGYRVWFGMLLEPPLVFLYAYLLRLGVLDGRPGFIAAATHAFYFFLRYAKIRQRQE